MRREVSPQVRHYFRSARGFGRLPNPTHQSELGDRGQGLFFHLQLRLSPAGMVEDLAFECPRCVAAVACGGYLHQRLVGRPLLPELTLPELLSDLGGLPTPQSAYAWMAVEALHRATLI